MVDWRKDACKTMWFLSDLEREQRGAKLTPEQHKNSNNHPWKTENRAIFGSSQ